MATHTPMERRGIMAPTPTDTAMDHQGMTRWFSRHPRRWRGYRYVYPVISRRAGGLSIGVNLNPDRACNFNCVYCQVDRSVPCVAQPVDCEQLRDELSDMLAAVHQSSFWEQPEFVGLPAAYRRVADIAFAGDGEPTACPMIDHIVAAAAYLRRAHGLHDAGLVLMTNATLLDRPAVQRALTTLDDHGGEVWAKLDAGDEAHYQQMNRSHVPFATVLRHIAACGRARPIVIQTMLAQLGDQPMSKAQFDRYLDRLCALRTQRCRIKRVQLYTIARNPAEHGATAVPAATLHRLARRLRRRLPDLPAEVFTGAD